MQEYFIQQVAANKGILYKICRSFCRNPADQDDLRQEILLRLWKGLPKYNPAHPFTTWMYRVALNTAISYYRQRKRDPGTIPLSEETHGAGGPTGGAHGIAAAGTYAAGDAATFAEADAGNFAAAAGYARDDADSPMARLQQQVAALKDLDKALMLLYFEERSYREIAEIMGITETNVATRVSRIKEKLKQAILNDKKTAYGRS
jgi:RNA polymerase sigma factor (sigma-70 family)